MTDCFELVSLLFLTVGRNNEPPAVYVHLPKNNNSSAVLIVFKLCSHRRHQGSVTPTSITYLISSIYHADPMKRLLEHLTESGNYSRKDLAPLERTITEIRRNIEQGRALYNPLIISMLESQVSASEASLKELKKKLEPVSLGLEPFLERLVSLRRSIKACESKAKVSKSS